MSLILVETDRAGFRRGRNLDKLGHLSSDTSELFFDQVRVPPGNLLGSEGDMAALMNELPQERLTTHGRTSEIMRELISRSL